MADRTDIHVHKEETIIVPSDVEPKGADRGADTEAIRAEIRETRERMSHTLDDISERLHPDVLKDQVKHKVREATIGRAEDMARHAAGRVTETRHSIMDTLRDNPVPAAMVGIGLGWLVWNGRKEESYRTAQVEYDVRYRGYDRGYGPSRAYYVEPGLAERASGRASEMGSEVRDRASEMGDRASDLADTAKDRAQGLAHQASDTVSDLADRTREAAGDMTDRARSAARQMARQTRRGTHRIEDRYEENPLGLGALAIALGFAAGLSAPTTRREVELMGDARDELVGRVREMASETAEKAQRVAGQVADEVGSTAKETAQQAAKQEGLTSSQGSSSSSSQGGSSGSGLSGTTGQGASGGTGLGSVPGGTALGDTHTRPGGM